MSLPTDCCIPLDPRGGWDLVQRDWGRRQHDAARPLSSPLVRLVVSALAVVQVPAARLARLVLGALPSLRARFAPRRRSFASAAR
jgi:hypothetical protein